MASEAQKSRKNAQNLLAAFEEAAQKAGVLHEIILERCLTSEVPDLLVEYARLRDLTIVSVPESYDQWYAEAVIFGSGRPTLVLPEAPAAIAGMADSRSKGSMFSSTSSRRRNSGRG